MKRYEKYKDSGIEWIGDIPEHWEVKKLNYCFSVIGSGTTPTAGKTEYYNNGEYNWLQTGDLNNSEIIETSKKITQEALDDYSTLRFYVANSIVIAMYGATIGKTGLLKIQSTTNQACCVLSEPIKLNSKFAFYWLNSIKNHIISLSYGGGQPNINQEQIRNLKVQNPTPEEQTAIANYLDRKTAEIDELIADKKRLLELYEEEKTAIINQAVTKGINPNVPMKDSGIEWLGEIPEHWDVLQLRHCIDVLTDFTANGSFASLAKNVNYLNSGYSRLVRLTDLRLNLQNEGLYVTEDAHNFLSKSELNGGEILLANVGAYAGLVIKMPVFEGKYTLGPNMFLIRVNQNTDYFDYMLNSKPVNSNLRNIALSSAQPKLNKDNIKSIIIVLPPKLEQKKIVFFLDTEISELERKSNKTKKLIDLLIEYRTALISEVVTGKIKVTE